MKLALSTRPAGIIAIRQPVAPDPDPDERSSIGIERDNGPLAELRAYLTESRQHLDLVARALRDNGSPGVLETRTITIPATGYVERSFRVPYAAVKVSNLGLQTPVIATTASAQNSAPGGGQGQIVVPPASWSADNMTGQTLTLYGTPGDLVTYSVLINRIQPSAGPLNVGVQTLWTNVTGTGASATGANISSNGASPVIATQGCGNLGLMVAITAAPTGTGPTLTVGIAGFDFPGSPNAYGLGATTALGAVGNTDVASGVGTNNGFVIPALVQVTWTIAGTGGPDFPNVDITLIGRSR